MFEKLFTLKIFYFILILSIVIDIILSVNIVLVGEFTWTIIDLVYFLVHHISFIGGTIFLIYMILYLIFYILDKFKYQWFRIETLKTILYVLLTIIIVGGMVYGLFLLNEETINQLFIYGIFIGLGVALLFLSYFIFYDLPKLYIKEYKNKNIIFDVKTFKYLGGGYAKDKYNSYFNQTILPVDLDIKKSKVVGDNYIKDSNYVLFGDTILKGCKVDYFKLLGGFYSTDHKNIFYKNIKITGVDIDSFKYIGKNISRDQYNIYFGYKKFFIKNISFIGIYGEGILYKLPKEKEIFFTTKPYNRGEILKGNHIKYIGGSYVQIDEKIFGPIGSFLTKYNEITPSMLFSIRYVKDNHLKIGEKYFNGYMFIYSNKINIISQGISYDDDNIYYYNTTIKKTETCDISNIEYGFIKDENGCYFDNKFISDPMFQYIGGNYYQFNGKIYSNDKNNCLKILGLE